MDGGDDGGWIGAQRTANTDSVINSWSTVDEWTAKKLLD